jgi:ankyrin repeat protein
LFIAALLRAASQNQVGCMEILGEAEADLDKADKYGTTPLMAAAVNGRTAAVEWLLGRGADWRLTAKDGNTALGRAKANGPGMGRAEAAAALEAWIAEHP